MPSKGGSQRRSSGPNACGASSVGFMDDSPDEEAGDGGSRGVSTPQNQKKVSDGIIPVSRGKRASSPSNYKSSAQKKKSRQADGESDPDDDDSPLTLRAVSKEVIPSGAQPCSFDGKVKQNRTIINRIACPTAVSIASRAFHAAEASIARSEALAAAVVANGIFGKGDSGREAYERSLSEHPKEYRIWAAAFNDTCRNASSVSMINPRLKSACDDAFDVFIVLISIKVSDPLLSIFMQKNLRIMQRAWHELFSTPCPSKDAAKDDAKAEQLQSVLGDFLGLREGESIFTDCPIFGPDCCNDTHATIFPRHPDDPDNLGKLVVSQNQMALDFHRAVSEYPVINPLLFFRRTLH